MFHSFFRYKNIRRHKETVINEKLVFWHRAAILKYKLNHTKMPSTFSDNWFCCLLLCAKQQKFEFFVTGTGVLLRIHCIIK